MTLWAVPEARAAILAACSTPLGAERIDLGACLGRVLAEPLEAHADLPPFDVSAMDGYALRAADAHKGARLSLVGVSQAGHLLDRTLADGEAIQINTGARVPDDAELVTLVEWTRREGDQIVLERPPGAAGSNIRRRGEAFTSGQALLPAGTVLDPGAIGLAAAANRCALRVHRRPVVAILVTGDELLEPGDPARAGAIRSSNAAALVALTRQAGGIPRYCGIAPDTRSGLRSALSAALPGVDVLLTTGGVSMGAFDFVKDELRALGARYQFEKVAMRPGKPNAFATLGRTLLFGLPGNPVSALVGFLQFVRPALLQLQGVPGRGLPRVRARLSEPVRTRPGLRYFLRARLDRRSHPFEVATTGPQGSHVLRSVADADCLVVVPEGVGALAAGSEVDVELIPSTLAGQDLSTAGPAGPVEDACVVP